MTSFSHLLRKRATHSEICAVKEEIIFIIPVPFVELGFPSVYTDVFIISQVILKCYTSYKTQNGWRKLQSAEAFIFFDRIAFLFFHSIGTEKVSSPFINIIKALKKVGSIIFFLFVIQSLVFIVNGMTDLVLFSVYILFSHSTSFPPLNTSNIVVFSQPPGGTDRKKSQIMFSF